ncbi:hypothetical protein [Oceanobacillus bengalensis]|uniref:Uncharacterized protein n=1 Tax=Oceanobacillus bengalensis TaxID=1435466 RepID=A0A494YSR7_9BACI|nr:hypothetical protein [Oceanobacillus bengalensis]RKQ12869.1 hypothetical protein D8M05_17510 [Oceanobacillus bengalensis]
MGLYINHKQPSIYKNNKNLSEPNQGIFIKKPMAEMIEQQKDVNLSLQKSFHGLKGLYEAQEQRQSVKWNAFNEQLTELKEMNIKQEQFEKHVIEELKRLETENIKIQSILKENRLSEQEMKEVLAHMGNTQQTIVNQLQEYGNSNNEMMGKMDKQITTQMQMADKLSLQEQNNQDVLKRLGDQEALSEKISRQLDYFRSILFERTSFLSEKIEDVSTFVMNAISKSDDLQKNRIIVQKQKANK